MESKSVKLVSKDYILIMMAAMGTCFVNYFFFAVLPLFAEKITGTVVFAGLLSMVFSITALVTRPVTGLIADKYGRVKLVIIGSVIAAVACALYSFTFSLILLVLIRILNGIGMSMATTSAGAAVPDIVPKERLAEGVGLYGLYATVAQAVGPLIALAIVGAGEMENYHNLFYVSAVFCLASALCGCFIKYERNRAEKQFAARESIGAQESECAPGSVTSKSAGTPDGAVSPEYAAVPECTAVPEYAVCPEYAAVPEDVIASKDTTSPKLITSPKPTTSPKEIAPLKENAPLKGGDDQEADEAEGRIVFGFDVRVLGPALITLLYFFAISSVLSYLTLYGMKRGFQVEYIGWFFLVTAVGMLPTRFIFGRIVDKRGGDIVIIPGLIAICICLFIIPLMPSLPLLICVALPYGVAGGAVAPSILSVMFKRCSPKRRGTVSAANLAAVDVGITLGAPFFAWIADHVSFTWVYWLSAVIAGLAVLAYVFFVSDKQTSRRAARLN